MAADVHNQPWESSSDRLTVESPNDRVTVESSNGGLSVESSNDGLTVESSNDRLTVESSNGGLSVESSNGGLTVESSNDRLTVESSNGGLSVESSNGGLSVESSNGGLSVESSNGGLSVESSNWGLTVESSNDRLTVERLRTDRADSPTPGLVEGTEPGAGGQQSAMFVHTQSFDDLTADTEGEAEPEPAEGEELTQEEEGLTQEEEEEEGPDDDACQVVAEQPEGAEPVRGGGRDKEEDVTSEAWRAHRKHVFVLSEAGKPIWSRYGTEEALSSTMGVMMALVSFIEASKNAIRSIQGDGYRVVFLRKSPLVLVGVSQGSQSDAALLRELQYVYFQIVSLLTLAQLQRLFQSKQNYDLRRLLSGSEHLTASLLRLLERDPGPTLSAVTCLPLPAAARDVISSTLQQARARSLVFSLLLAGTQLVSLVRKRDQHLHHVDLHLLLNLVTSSSSAFREGEGWTPVCLPKFNTAGFFHAHVSYLLPGDDLCLVLLSTEREDFFALSACKRRFLERLQKRSAFGVLKEALASPSYPVTHVGIPELRHFVYKSKSSGLYTSPELLCPYSSVEERERLMSLYQQLHSRLHHPTRTLVASYHTTHTENLYARVTSGFELYLCFSPLGTKAVAEAAVNKLLKWIRREEDRLFILSPLTY
ncbi:vacuolar fusion protein MON1 homolog A isoform X3 [Sardina pilchardus]|uniref:vacuolar fusion protein MON1 homolog A isoform X3 n=1 Tax=Sardina pilchardus TaxID=27697 RepID=UPI002E160941